jgi:hypothetical protein
MQVREIFGEGESLLVGGRTEPAVSAAGFVVCPAPLMGAHCMVGGGAGWTQELYRLAHEQARAALRASLYERAWAASRN